MNISKIHLGNRSVGDILRNELGLNEDYVAHLISADAWSMMILSWALVETCLNQTISGKLGRESLNAFVEKLPIAGRTGKAELACSLDVITTQEKKFIEVFSGVRNRFAHGIGNFKISFAAFFASVNNVRQFEDALFIKEIPAFDGSRAATFENEQRSLILVNVIVLCVNMLQR